MSRLYDRVEGRGLRLLLDLAQAEGSLEAVMARVNAFLDALRERGSHTGLAVGKGRHLCVTCETPFPCKLVRSRVPSLR